MGLINCRITLVQKNLNFLVEKEQRNKIKDQNSNFLLFPDYYPALDRGLTLNSIIQKNKINLDNITGINNFYKGAVIGGTIAREIAENVFYCSTPIIQNSSVITWYDKETLTDNESFIFKSSHNTERIFIINQIQFGIISGEEIYNESLVNSLVEKKVRLIFHLDNVTEGNVKPYSEEVKFYNELSMEKDLFIIRVCGFGEVNSKKRFGRSLFATPNGIQWKVSEQEQEEEIIKTLNFQIKRI